MEVAIIVGKFAAEFLAALGTMRAIAEVLIKIGGIIHAGEKLVVLGKAIGKFGFGTPKVPQKEKTDGK
jgi:hypothetical protein